MTGWSSCDSGREEQRLEDYQLRQESVRQHLAFSFLHTELHSSLQFRHKRNGTTTPESWS